ncbi:MAG: UDP-N-acetylglucosamine 2-epimerase, partial [Thiotrichaceae bacterium]
IEIFGLDHYFSDKSKSSGIIASKPLGYLEFLHLVMNSQIVLTDSGGIQEETTVLGIPCVTMRENTERPITCEIGSNVLVGSDPNAILKATEEGLEGSKKNKVPKLWDGNTATRITDILLKI